MARTDARDVCMRVCYARLLGGDDGASSVSLMEERILTEADEAYIHKTLDGIAAMRDRLDAAIARHLVGWTIERLARVDLSILRLAAFEILGDSDVPASAAINEAVELARTYSTDEAPSFINGVLGSIIREKDAP